MLNILFKDFVGCVYFEVRYVRLKRTVRKPDDNKEH